MSPDGLDEGEASFLVQSAGNEVKVVGFRNRHGDGYPEPVVLTISLAVDLAGDPGVFHEQECAGYAAYPLAQFLLISAKDERIDTIQPSVGFSRDDLLAEVLVFLPSWELKGLLQSLQWYEGSEVSE